MATRRMAGGRLDHGAQFFTVRDSRFQKYVDEWLSAGVIREWFRHSPQDTNPDGYPRYCGVNGMTDAPKFLAESLDIERSQQITELSRKLWVRCSVDQRSFHCHRLPSARFLGKWGAKPSSPI